MPDDTTPRSKIPKAGYNELGVTGLHQFHGTIFEEFLPQLQGTRGVKIYREMSDNSAIVRSMLTAIESLLRSVDWTVEPATEKRADLKIAEFVEECKNDMSHTWEDFISEVLTMLVYGWSYFEIVYKKRKGPTSQSPKFRSKYTDGKIGWRKFAPRAQTTLHRWEIDQEGGLQGMYQRPLNVYSDIGTRTFVDGSIYLPIEKSLLFRTTSTRNNPEGRSILRSAYRSWYFGKRVEEIEVIGVERDLAGMPIAWVPPEILDTERTAEATATYDYIKDVVTRVKRDEMEGIIFPLAYDEVTGNELYRFELLTSGGRRQFDTGAIVQRYNQAIALSTLSDFILLGHENVGSFALSSDKTELFAVALGSWLDSIQEVINRHAIPRLMQLNGIKPESWPRIEHGDIESPDIQELSTYLQQLTAAGAAVFNGTEDDITLLNHLLTLADLPEKDPDLYREVMEEKKQREEEMLAAGGMLGPQKPPMNKPGANGSNGSGNNKPGASQAPNQQPGSQRQNLGSTIQKILEEEPELDDEQVVEKAIRAMNAVWTQEGWKRVRGRRRWGP